MKRILQRTYGWQDQFWMAAEVGLKALFMPSFATRVTPTKNIPETPLLPKNKQKSSRLLRVDHAGEVCAQALYHGQAFVAKQRDLKTHLLAAAEEERDHLVWCQERLHELSSHVSYLNPLWYMGSFLMGVIAGSFGNTWSLGFIAETERQVVRHLEKHLEYLPPQDQKSQILLMQMQEDEKQHATAAWQAGAQELPWPIRIGMRQVAKIMTNLSYWV